MHSAEKMNASLYSNNSKKGMSCTVTVEIRLREGCCIPFRTVQTFMEGALPQICVAYERGVLELDEESLHQICSSEDELFSAMSVLSSIETIFVDTPSTIAAWEAPRLEICVYQTSNDAPCDEMLEDNADEVPTHFLWTLPHQDIEGAWESLHFEQNIKDDLLQYSKTAMYFSERCIDTNIISLNRVVLLHGPPGTGKTTLCKALAQKLSIRLGDIYDHSLLVEINAHSLFSKWFSESGKLVMKVFSKIKDIVEDSKTFVCILIDEVESLTAARSSAINNSEPSDAIRVVNAILTQLDSLKKYSNTLVLTTSNITTAIDTAFLDRVDMRYYIGPPGPIARFHIFKSCVDELVRVGIVQETQGLAQDSFKSSINEYDNQLMLISQKANNFSGRSLRKLSVRAFACYLKSRTASMEDFLQVMLLLVEKGEENSDTM